MTRSAHPDTIFALSSGRGRSGVAIIRLSGSGARTALEAISGPAPDVRQASLRKLIDPTSSELLDEAVVLRFDAPASFTGEDVVELHVHGGSAVIEGVLSALADLEGLRNAEAGEFSRRAFDNDKLDLTEVEGLADLIDAETQAQRRQALRQSGGDLRTLCEDWREQIIHASSLVEAALDFSDEADVPDLVERQAKSVVEEMVEALNAHLENAIKGERLRDGYQVVLAGAPNSGKSSLLNALSKRDVAIVSDQPGTTRDVIEMHLDLDGYPVTLIDTAGLRESSGEIELEGMRRTRAAAKTADLVLWMVDATAPQWEAPADLGALGNEGDGVLTLVNKIDSGNPDQVLSTDVLSISVKTGEGLGELITKLSTMASEGMDADEPIVVTRQRQRRELETCCKALKAFLENDVSQLELRAEDLRVAGRALSRLSGRVDVEDVLDRIFGDFCIGK
jgi:tRNA modification GTPase